MLRKGVREDIFDDPWILLDSNLRVLIVLVVGG
jgi:hypothetical protein